MTETEQAKGKDRERSRGETHTLVTRSGTIMTHLMTYSAPTGSQYRLHDAEYKGKHYFDFRRYDPRTRGGVPTQGGLRLNPRTLEFLEDAMMRWRRFYKQSVVQEGKREV